MYNLDKGKHVPCDCLKKACQKEISFSRKGIQPIPTLFNNPSIEAHAMSLKIPFIGTELR